MRACSEIVHGSRLGTGDTPRAQAAFKVADTLVVSFAVLGGTFHRQSLSLCRRPAWKLFEVHFLFSGCTYFAPRSLKWAKQWWIARASFQCLSFAFLQRRQRTEVSDKSHRNDVSVEVVARWVTAHRNSFRSIGCTVFVLPGECPVAEKQIERARAYRRWNPRCVRKSMFCASCCVCVIGCGLLETPHDATSPEFPVNHDAISLKCCTSWRCPFASRCTIVCGVFVFLSIVLEQTACLFLWIETAELYHVSNKRSQSLLQMFR